MFVKTTWGHHHHHSVFAHHVPIRSSILKKMIRRSYRKNRNFKIHGFKKTESHFKKLQMY